MELDLHAAAGVAVREYPTERGPADYELFVDGQPQGYEPMRDTIN